MQTRRRTARAEPAPGAAGVTERIVFVTTADGLTLRGLLVRAPKRREGSPLVLWFHTRQQGFAEPEYVEIGRRMAAEGFDFLTADTRGHDFGAWFRTAEGPVLGGSAWERFSDCTLDIEAWMEAAAAHGRAVLVGHGFAGAKVLHFQAQRQRPDVAAVFLASSGTAVRDKYGDEAMALATRMAAEGHGRDLMPWGTGGEDAHAAVSADWFVARGRMHREVYGDGSVPPAVARVRCPIVAWYGRRESHPTRDARRFLAWLRDNAVAAASFEGHMLDDVGFYCRGQEGAVVALMTAALERLGAAAPRDGRAEL